MRKKFILFQKLYKSNLKNIYNKKELFLKEKLIDASGINKISLDLISSLYDLHQKKIMHRDIKPDNILIDYSDGVFSALFTDFGLSMHEEDYELRIKHSGTPIFNSPRYWQTFEEDNTEENGLFQYYDDIWALGISLYYLKFARYPSWTKKLLDCMRLNESFLRRDEGIRELKKSDDNLSLVILGFLKLNPKEQMSLKNAQKLLSF